MASILRQIVAGPRARHEEAGLDLCYITDRIIATSGPSSSYPSRAYRNPVEDLVRWLDFKHGDNWAIWEFRAEGTGYPDDAVYGRVKHFPWPDHHPPPFHLVPLILQGMKEWLDDENRTRVVVVHCKAGKGRSGTMACSYLMSEEGWAREDVMQRFTERRMRPGFGPGISIPSQKRWLTYVERWKDHGKIYIEQQIAITEVHVWGLRSGVKIAVEGYVDEGRKIKTFHVFTDQERDDSHNPTFVIPQPEHVSPTPESLEDRSTGLKTITRVNTSTTTSDAIFIPSTPIVIPSNDINIDCERRSRAGYGWTLVTSVAHVWFNCFFEGNGPERCDPARSTQSLQPDDSGVFAIDWDAMDGIKGSSRKGKRAFDRMAVVWRTVPVPDFDLIEHADAAQKLHPSIVVQNSRGQAPSNESPDVGKLSVITSSLGLRKEDPSSANVSKETSVKSIDLDADDEGDVGHESDVDITQPHVPGNK